MTKGDLPQDIDTCHDIILTQHHNIQRLQQQVEHLLRKRQLLQGDNGDDGQLALFGEAIAPAADQEASAPETIEVRPHRRRGKGHGRRRRDLRRERVVHELLAEELSCPCCENPRVKIGEEVSEQLEYQPAEVYIVEHVRVKYACKQCQEHVVVADKPIQPIEKGLPGPGLLSFVATSKYCDHQPLHRLERILGRLGADISRSTMCGWMAASAALVEPLYALMKEEVLKSKVIHTDDTSVPVLDPPMNKTKSGRLWVYVGDAVHPYTVFDYSPTHEGAWPFTFLKPFKGYLQADAYRGYDALYADGRIQEVACWAHARRKFEEAESSDAARSLTAVVMIRKLYDIEREATESTAEQRRRMRQEQSLPQLRKIKAWLQQESIAVLPKSPIGKAIAYVLSNWEAFERYTRDGDLNIDNNASERALRHIVVGRNNWIFAGSDNGGRTAAVLCSFVSSCKRHQVDPFAYLRDVFTHLPACPVSQIDRFLPDRWQRTPE